MRSILFLVLFGVALADFDWDDWTNLDEYVHRDDGVFGFTEVVSYRYNATNCTVYVYNMTSQRYQDENKVDKSIWWHWVGVSVPDDLVYDDFAFMLIDGGSNREGDSPPGFDSLENVGICTVSFDTKTFGGYVKQVPNQPIVFANDPSQRSRSEDTLIAWTWRTFIDTLIAGEEEPDPEVILRMPMTKSAKRGLDTIAAVAAEKVPGSNVDRFLVTGASKRGWTTYSLAATDRRVVNIAPIVFSLLNADDTLMHHYRSMDGGWSFALGPYFRENLTLHLLDEELIAPVMEIEDVFNYRERFRDLPMLQIVGTGDEFFLNTDSHHWWDDFPAKKWMMMNQNANHALVPAYVRIIETVVSWVQAFLQGVELPTVSWTMDETEDGGSIEMRTSPPALNVTGWRSVTLENNTRRDYRMLEGEDAVLQPVFWFPTIDVEDLSDDDEGVYLAETTKEDGEWVGFFIQGQWEGPTGLRMFFTTEVNVIPDTFPIEPCEQPEECFGKIV